ncbi:hypothetical protein [Streptomyces olivochromogenes]|uniref:Uncharacterized protein n=1 Tax=Streptomyces olivochromogenes TaxID=1963 RepID=A0A250VTK3_STROL|nr:hypothetical protein [Streptomyces olivochromogenes]GAX57568.1 hypothetical protein SO3561_09138 [Streptomyces olivochromogenes]
MTAMGGQRQESAAGLVESVLEGRALALLTEHADVGVLIEHASFDVLLARRL